MSNDTAREYNLTVSPLWTTAKGNFKSIKIGPEQFDALQQVAIGGMLLVKISTAKNRRDTSPHAYLEYLTPEKVAQAASEAKAREEKSTADSL